MKKIFGSFIGVIVAFAAGVFLADSVKKLPYVEKLFPTKIK